MWTLAVYLPLMIVNDVTEDDLEWECFLLLLDILLICATRLLSTDLVEAVSSYFPRMLPTPELDSKTALLGTFAKSDFKVCYCFFSYLAYRCMVVYSTYRLGPLTASWCMRMEAKNRRSLSREISGLLH